MPKAEPKEDEDASASMWAPGILKALVADGKTVPLETSAEFLHIEGGTVIHKRGGTVDIARGTSHLRDGRYRIEYNISGAVHRARGFGIILGVSDAEAGCWDFHPEEALPDEAPKRIKSVKPFMSWGLDPSSGRLISSADPKKGRFGGATVGEPLVARDSGEAVAGMSVVIEADVPPLLTKEQVMLTRRDFSTALHPLEKTRNFPLHLKHVSSRTMPGLAGEQLGRKSSLTFSINGGPATDTGVRLPESGVFPFVHLTGEGDAVTLVSITKLSD